MCRLWNVFIGVFRFQFLHSLFKLLTVRDSDPDFRLAKRIAADAIAGRVDDPTYGATAYRVADQPWPYTWGHFRLPLAEIGLHAFYNFAREP